MKKTTCGGVRRCQKNEEVCEVCPAATEGDEHKNGSLLEAHSQCKRGAVEAGPGIKHFAQIAKGSNPSSERGYVSARKSPCNKKVVHSQPKYEFQSVRRVSIEASQKYAAASLLTWQE